MDTVDAAISITKSSDENNLQGIYQSNIKRGIREGNDSRPVLGDITNRKRCTSTGIKRRKIESENPEAELLINPSQQKKARSSKKEMVDQNRKGETIEIMSSMDEDEEIASLDLSSDEEEQHGLGAEIYLPFSASIKRTTYQLGRVAKN